MRLPQLCLQGFIQGVGTRDFPPPPKNFEIDKVNMKYKYDANYCSSSWTKLLALCFHGKAFICDGDPGRGFI